MGKAFPGYRNHVIRVAGFAFLLHPCDENAKRKILIAACFHDLGIWSDGTFDYIDPSMREAESYLRRNGLEAWSDEILRMISEHHKLRSIGTGRDDLAEAFRKADRVDLSLGLVGSGIPGSAVRRMRALYPNAGFHKCLLATAARWFLRHPRNPFPMVKW